MVEMCEAINKTYLLPFPVSLVYKTWTSSNTVIAPATSMEINPVVGGIYRLNIDSENGQIYNEGKFLQVIPEHLIQYCWEWNGDGDVTQITVIFSGQGSGTELRLQHSGFTSAESLKMHDEGWDSFMTGISKFMEKAEEQD